jgi:UDPglucose--hexose-1-phosphate uridylyltransferase
MDYSKPHRRYNPLSGEWVLVSPHRASRPWQGQVEKNTPEILPEYDEKCYLCPGNSRAGGKVNPKYISTFVFDNDYPALLTPDETNSDQNEQRDPKMFTNQAEPVNGICRVVCFSPRHDLTLPELSIPEIEAVLTTWTKQTSELGNMESIDYVQVFENKGAMMGCSNPHPHSQIWATSFIPNEPLKELESITAYEKKYHSCLICDYLKEEIDSGERIVAMNEYFVALVPFWAIWPFEIMIIPKNHRSYLNELNQDEVILLAHIMKEVTTKYDNLFEISFPYSMGFHQAPTNKRLDYSAYHMHIHYFPPLLRSATVKKFMVGFEMLAMPQRDLTPETAAKMIRELPNLHYKKSLVST